MVRAEKKKALKRAKNFSDAKQEDIDNDDEVPTERKVDKNEIKDKIEKGEYDLSHHFSKKAVLQLEVKQKVTSFVPFWFSTNKK
jgi:DNA-nicking Smr family endonuclease